MDDETLNSYIKAGKIAAEALQYGKSLVKPGNSLFDVTRKVEVKIKELGGELAFPVQMSCNDIAAHFCPELDDKIIFSDQLVCLDVGVHINGCIGDTATTIDLSGKYKDLIIASSEALDNAIKVVKPGTSLRDVGTIIQETIASFGFVPVKNLSGHGLDKFNIHSAPSIPNFDSGDNTKLFEDQVIAIEPFASNGAGIVFDLGNASVFQLIQKKPVRHLFVKQVSDEIERFGQLPFAKWWLQEKLGVPKVNFALRELERMGVIRSYPPLVDKAHGIVSQAEHSLIVKEKPIVLTKI